MRRLFLILAGALMASGAVLAAGTQTATLDVTNMDCAACPITVRKALEKVSGVEKANVDYKTKRAVVAFDPTKTTPDALMKATAAAGYPSSVHQVQ